MTKIRGFVSITLTLALSLIALGLFGPQSAHAQLQTTPDTSLGADNPNGGVVWCNGDSSAFVEYSDPAVPGTSYPDTIAPDGLGANPSPTTVGQFGSDPVLENSNANSDLGNDGVTQFVPVTGEDQYAIQLNYWNSITSTPQGAIGYSTGNSCILFHYNDGNIGQFEITYPANPPQPAPVGTDTNNEQTIWATGHPNSFPWYGLAPYTASKTQGGPTGYVSTWKGCSWDNNSCTPGSSFLPNAGFPNPKDVNSFPQLLSTLTSIPTTWNISNDSNYGDAFNTDGNHIWDSSYDIWFDKTAQTATGQAPYGPVRGQNDGLEIMVWMNSNHSYVDNAANGQFAQPNGAGFVEPSGWPRAQVVINNVLYDVWTARLDNPYFGYAASTGNVVLTSGEEPYTCPTLATYLTTNAGGTVKTNPAPGAVCGTEWNVVSFVATKSIDGASDYRRTGMTMDTKVFTDYILNIQDGLWATPTNPAWTDANLRNAAGVLECPASSMDNQQDHPLSSLPLGTSACLSQNWYLTSVQAGFEPWEGGNGLSSDSFQAHVFTTATTVQSGVLSGNKTPTVNWTQPFDVVYNCGESTAGQTAQFQLEGTNSQTGQAQDFPTSGFQAMTAVPGTNLFEFTVTQLFPIHGNATLTFQSSCSAGNQTATIFIDPSGQVFYSDGVTPAQGAKVTLSSAPSAAGPFVAVPNDNFGLASDIMNPDDNTVNPMTSTQFGAFEWDVAPGFYEVTAELDGCGTVTSPVQHVVSTPIENLYLVLPCAPPAQVVPRPAITGPVKTVTAAAASSSTINLTWSPVSLPAGATSLTYTVTETEPNSVVIATGLGGTSFTVTGLTPGTSYTFAITAVDSAGPAVPSPLASATTSTVTTGNCHVTYTVTSAVPGVANGLTANINIQNTGTTAIYPWTLSWTFAGNQTLSFAWNTQKSQSGKNVSLASTATWESIPAGATLSGAVGFNGSFTGTNTNPTAFFLNGSLCK